MNTRKLTKLEKFCYKICNIITVQTIVKKNYNFKLKIQLKYLKYLKAFNC